MPKRAKITRRGREDVPYAMRLPDRRTLLVTIPAEWCESDASGELAFTPEAVRWLDRVRAVAMRVPSSPTPGYIRTLREALGLTQTQMGERVGVDKMTVARWEWGRFRPGAEAVRAIDRMRRKAARHGVVIAA